MKFNMLKWVDLEQVKKNVSVEQRLLIFALTLAILIFVFILGFVTGWFLK